MIPGPVRPGAARQWRLGAGLVLFTYVLTHFINHAVGLVSLDAMESASAGFFLVWRSLPGTLALYGALVVHGALALRAVYRRRTLRMPPGDATQLLLGLLIPFLLIQHVVGTRGVAELTGERVGYAHVVRLMWTDSGVGLWQMAALTVVWVHGCIGLRAWLRIRDVYARLQPLLAAGALLVPVLAVAGFVQAGKEVEDLLGRGLRVPVEPPSGAVALALRMMQDMAFAVAILAVGGTVVARGLRAWANRGNLVRVRYPRGQRIAVPRGTTVLEASRIAGVPHLAVCGGRGRCSTCRIRVAEGLEHLPPPDAAESATLQRIGAEVDVRLACQLRPVADLAVVPLAPAPLSTAEATRSPRWRGTEVEVTVLFCDLRGFTALAEHRLPFDTVHLLNRYFAAVGVAVEQAGGQVDKFIGDGMMALFGIDGDRDAGCRQALDAAVAIASAISKLNRTLVGDLERPLRVAMGVHVGAAIVGEMGYGRATSLTAVGDSVNVASRLESVAKDMDAELVVSAPVAQHAGRDLGRFQARDLPVRGRSGSIHVHVVPWAADLADNGT